MLSTLSRCTCSPFYRPHTPTLVDVQSRLLLPPPPPKFAFVPFAPAKIQDTQVEDPVLPQALASNTVRDFDWSCFMTVSQLPRCPNDEMKHFTDSKPLGSRVGLVRKTFCYCDRHRRRLERLLLQKPQNQDLASTQIGR